MRLLVIRHAIAGDRESFARTGRPDAERPLTDEGRTKMARCARGLRAVCGDLDVLATSPFTRARETAEIVAQAYEQLRVTEAPALAHGGSRDDVLTWVHRQDADQIGLVGHEPDLGALIAWLVTGDAAPFVTLRKGGAGLLTFADRAGPGLAELRWVLTPKLLRKLGS